MKILYTFIFLTCFFLIEACSDFGKPVNCLSEIDCNGICGGNAQSDECGNCNDNPNDNCIKFSTNIQPIFDQYCINCHGNYFSSYLNFMEWNNNNNGTIIIANDYLNSKLWIEVSTGSMPQDANKLDQTLINLIANWIDQGALDN